MTRKTPRPVTMTGAERAAAAVRMLGKIKHPSWPQLWQDIADALGYGCAAEAMLACYRIELTPITPDMIAWAPREWKVRAKAWNAELARAGKAGKMITAKPGEPGYTRFAVDRVPDPPAVPAP